MSESNFIFYNAEFCPFGQRAWLAVLEKAVPHEYRSVNYFNKSLEKTKEFLTASPDATVPASRFNGVPIYDSIPLCEFLEDQFPDLGNPLFPKSSIGKFAVRRFITENNNIISTLYQYLMAHSEEGRDEKKEKFNEAIKKFGISLTTFRKEPYGNDKGDYVLGDQFTLADIMYLPFFERAFVLLPHYRDWTLPEGDEYEIVKRWYNAGTARDSFKTTAAPRTEESMSSQPFESVEREDFLIEVYQVYAAGKVGEGKKLLADAPAGKRTIPKDF